MKILNSMALGLSLSFAISLPAFAQQQPALDTSWLQGKTLEEAYKGTSTLSKEITVYHWVFRKYLAQPGGVIDKNSDINPKNPEVLNFVKANMLSRMKLFWDLNIPISGKDAKGNTMAPNGLYVANSPVISRIWGDTLYQMNLAQGMRFVNGRSQYAYSKEFVKTLESRGCYGKTHVRALTKSSTAEKECRKVLAEITLATQSSAVIYYFNTEPLPNCPKWSPAFVIVRPEAIVSSSIIPLSLPGPQQDDGHNTLRSTINALFTLAQTAKLSKHAPPFTASSLRPVTEEVARNFVGDSFFECQEKDMAR